MKFHPVLFFGLTLAHFSLLAGEHTISSLIGYHSEQDSSAGYGFIYQYKLLENVEFEAKYQQSGDLKIISDDQIVLGDYDSFSSGINFTKLHHKNLTLKLGLGVNLISSSSNHLLVEKEAIAPYLQIAASYKVTNNLSFTLGQSSQFNNHALGTNHSLFLSLNWLFSSATKPYSKPQISNAILPRITNNTFTKPTIVQPKATTIAVYKNPATTPMWYVQFGAYQQQENALQEIELLHEKHSLTFKVLLHNQLYRVLSQPFSTKTAALEHLLYLQNSLGISGFVNKI